MTTEQTYTFSSSDKVSTLHGVRWLPAGEPVAVLQIVHGMCEFIERYRPFAEYLNEHGYAVVGHDHIGHGQSVASNDELGIMHDPHPSDIMAEDIYRNYALNKALYPNVPYYIMGHSMGSYMTRKFLCVRANDLGGLNGAIIMGTGTEPDGKINMGLAIINLIALFKSDNYKSAFVRNTAGYKEWDETGADPTRSWLTKDVEIVERYFKEPRCTFTFSLGAYRGLVESTKYDNNPGNIGKMRKDLPVIFVSGAEDPVGNYGKGVRAAYNKFKAAGLQDVSIKIYENDRHEILNETDRDVVFRNLYDWMQSKA